MNPDGRRNDKTTLSGLFFLSISVLALEIAWTRILSVTLWYHFAFMVLSTALFGLGFAGVVLSLRRQAERVSPKLITWLALATPVSYVLGYILFDLIPYEPFSLGKDAMQWLYLPLSYLSVTLPFFFSGLTVAALLTRYAANVHKLYFFDLAGAGFGCILVVLALPLLGGPGTIFASAALASIAALLLSWNMRSRYKVLAMGLFVVLAASSLFAENILPVRISSNKVTGGGMPVQKLIRDKRFHRYSAWNTLSRIDVIEFRDQWRRVHRSILIDGGTAVTRLAHPTAPIADLGPTGDDESFFVKLKKNPKVLIVGSGGGREVLLALRNGAESVTAVEINPAINHVVMDKMSDFTGRLYDDPRVHAYTDEARSFIERTRKKFDLIQCPHTISNAAMASGSLSLAENYLLTVEAFNSYLDHLKPGGILLITRPEAQIPRLFVTARSVLGRIGIKNCRDKVMAWRRPARHTSFYAGFAMCKDGFSSGMSRDFLEVLARQGMEPLYVPGSGKNKSYYRKLLTANDPTKVKVPFKVLLSPATDDKPFFNRRTALGDIGLKDLSLLFSQGHGGRMALEDAPIAEASLVVLLLETTAIGLLLILLPLAVFRRRAMDGKRRLKTLAAFAGLGLAYMVVEVGLIQRLTLFLGEPMVVFAAVLGGLLISSGIGSFVSGNYSGRLKARWTAAAAGSMALVTAFSAPYLVNATLALPEIARIMIAIAFIFPVGFFMGMTFPILISNIEKSYPERVPWAYGMNGFASVVGSESAVLLGMLWGYTAVLLCGVAAYFLVALIGDLDR
ncbi:MAG: hypothetical protein GXP49_12145 [Deltaproteobacteria bacterium]|nr:hypothetical protein [Deltaproteobacteria bacterium]